MLLASRGDGLDVVGVGTACMSVFMLCWIDYVVEILPICRNLEILYGNVCLSL